MNRFTRMLCAASALALTAATAAQAGVISGRVTEGSGTVGLEGAIIRIVETGQTVTAGRDGAFRFANVPSGDYTIEVSYLGADAQTRMVSLATQASEVETSFRLGADVAVTENILVIGQRGALTGAINRQRAADGFVTVLSADAVDRLPDENIAEAVRRAAGVNVLNDQGEGRFVSIRGIDPNLNTVSINGVRLPSPEADARQVPLDVIDSDVLSSIVISKSLTPDMPGDSIGGNIEIETLSGLDQDDRLLQFRLRGIYADIADAYGYRGSVTFADNFMDGRLGVAFSYSDQEREFGSDNVEVDGGWDFDESVAFPGEYELRDYDITRERTSVVFNLDFDVNESTDLYLRTTYSEFSDQEYRARVENKFEDGEYDDAASGGASFLVNGTDDDEYEVDRDIKDRLESQTIYAIAAGGETFAGPWTFEYQLSYAFAEEAEDDRIDAAFRQQFDSGSFGLDVTDSIVPTLIFGDAASRDAYYDASGYEFDELEFLNGVSQDDEWAANFDLRRETQFGRHFGFVQAGVSSRIREKSFEAELEVYDGFGPRDLFLDEFAFQTEFGLDDIGTTPDPFAIRDFFLSNRADFELDVINTALGSTGDFYAAEEDVLSGYLMASVDVDRLRIVGGVRVEDTQYDARGFEVLEQAVEVELAGDQTGAFAGFIPAPALPGDLIADTVEAEYDAGDDETVIEGDRVFRRDVTVSNDYTDVLPSINLRYEASDRLILRGAYYASISRPNLEQAAPRVAIEQSDDGDVEAEFGNPDLERQEAHNFDAAIEYYPNRDSVLSFGVFYKSIDNFIAAQQFEDITVNGIDIDEGSSFVNIEESSLLGFEVNYQQALTFLPGVLQNMIVGANYTYVDSEATLPGGREITLPNQSQNVANLILGYDDGDLDLRVAVSYRDEFIDGIDEGGEGVDRIADSHVQLDFSAKYDLTDNLRAYLDFKNINDEPFVAVFRDGGREFNSQYEEYGWQAQFGFRYTFGG
ncbi:MAG: TonB-dependent receptor [Pseudomonadota bacterium]